MLMNINPSFLISSKTLDSSSDRADSSPISYAENQVHRSEILFRSILLNDNFSALDSFQNQINIPFEDGELPLHFAIKNMEKRHDNYNTVRRLLFLGADPYLQDKWGKTAFDYAVYNQSAMQELFQKITSQTPYHQDSLLMKDSIKSILSGTSPIPEDRGKGSINGLWNKIQSFIDQAIKYQGPLIDLLQKTPRELESNPAYLEKLLSSDPEQLPLTHLAAAFASVETFDFLYNKGILLNQKNDLPPPVLFCAICNSPALLRYFLQKNICSIAEFEESFYLLLYRIRKKDPLNNLVFSLKNEHRDQIPFIYIAGAISNTIFSFFSPGVFFDPKAKGLEAFKVFNVVNLVPKLIHLMNHMGRAEDAMSSDSLRETLTESVIYLLGINSLLPPAMGSLYFMRKIYQDTPVLLSYIKNWLTGYYPSSENKSLAAYSALEALTKIFFRISSLTCFSFAMLDKETINSVKSPWIKTASAIFCLTCSLFKGFKAVFGMEGIETRCRRYASGSRGLLGKTVEWIIENSPLKERMGLAAESLMFAIPAFILYQDEQVSIKGSVSQASGFFEEWKDYFTFLLRGESDEKLWSCIDQYPLHGSLSSYQKCKKMESLISCIHSYESEMSLEDLQKEFFKSNKTLSYATRSEKNTQAFILRARSIEEWVKHLQSEIGNFSQNCEALAAKEILVCANSHPISGLDDSKCPFSLKAFKKCMQDIEKIETFEDLYKRLKQALLYIHPDKKNDTNPVHVSQWLDFFRVRSNKRCF